jgi:hypothetical protein
MLTTSYSIDIIHVHIKYVVQFAYLHPNTPRFFLDLYLEPVLESQDWHVHRLHEPQCVNYPQSHFDRFTCIIMQCTENGKYLKNINPTGVFTRTWHWCP